MSQTRKNQLSEVMNMAWSFVKKYGITMSEALVKAWRNIKLKVRMLKGIVEFRFIKMDGSVRQAFGTIAEHLVPELVGSDRRRSADCQTYYDTEKGAWRCFKRINLLG